MGCEIVFQLFQDTRFGIWDSRYCLFIFVFRTQDSGFDFFFVYLFRAQDLGFGISEFVFPVSLHGRGFGIRDLSNCLFIYLFRTQDLGFLDALSINIFRAQDLGFGICEIIFPCIFRAQDLGFGISDIVFPVSLHGRGFGIRDLSNCLFIYLFRTQDLGFQMLFP